MKFSEFISAATAAVILAVSAVPFSASAADTKKHNVIVLDFEGRIMETLSVEDGKPVDLSKIDTSKLERHLDIYTQIAFSSWGNVPDKVTSDVTIQALYKKAVISLDSLPTKKEYLDNWGDIDLSGLNVTITMTTQLPEKDKDGHFKTKTETVNIGEHCTSEPSRLENAFANSDSATVKVYPIVGDVPIATYDISYYPYLGDADMNGFIDASDATYILMAYSSAATGSPLSYAPGQKKRCDIDGNGSIDSNDATMILQFYTYASVTEHPSWNEILKK